MKRIIQAVIILIAGLLGFIPQLCHADSADVLLKGLYAVDATYYHYFDINKRYNPDGKTEDISVDFNGDLDSTVFGGLEPLDPLVGRASIGRSVVDFTRVYRWSSYRVAYGLTEKLSIGIELTYNYSKNKVEAHLDPTNANVGKNPLYGTGILPEELDVPFIPIDTTGTYWEGITEGIPLEDEDVQDLLGDGLDVNDDGTIDIDGYGYKRFETWSGAGFGDILLGGKYRIYGENDLAFAFTGGVQLPTGKVDDPDNITDISFGDGQTDLVFRLHADYTGIDRIYLNTTVSYNLQLPDREVKRIPVDVNQPLISSDNKENVKRDLGDIIDIEVTGSYAFNKQWSGGLVYNFTKGFKDKVRGSKEFIYSSLEDETDSTSHMALITLGYSTMQMYIDNKFPLPLSASISFRDRFAGTNNVTKSQFVSLGLSLYFK